MLDHAREGIARPMLRDEFIALAAQASFTAIRLPVRWDARAGVQPPYRIDPAFFERVDGVLRQAAQHGLAVILDMHHYAQMMLEPQSGANASSPSGAVSSTIVTRRPRCCSSCSTSRTANSAASAGTGARGIAAGGARATRIAR